MRAGEPPPKWGRGAALNGGEEMFLLHFQYTRFPMLFEMVSPLKKLILSAEKRIPVTNHPKKFCEI